jgi:CspA family cold shock protein
MITTGKVKWFNSENGFGFIEPAAGGVDIFLHVTQLVEGIDNLHPGDRVLFEEVPLRW